LNEELNEELKEELAEDWPEGSWGGGGGVIIGLQLSATVCENGDCWLCSTR